MKRTPKALLLMAIVTCSIYVDAQAATAAVENENAYDSAVKSLSGKRPYASDQHKERTYAYLPLLSHKELSLTEKEQLWNLYLLRLMTHKVTVNPKQGDSYVDLKNVPALHEERWHPLRNTIKDKSIQQFVGIVTFATFCFGIFSHRGQPLQKRLRRTMVGVSIISVPLALLVVFMAFMHENGFNRIEFVYRALNELREDEECRKHIPLSVLRRLDNLYADLASVVLNGKATDAKYMRERHDRMLRFYAETLRLVPAEII